MLKIQRILIIVLILNGSPVLSGEFKVTNVCRFVPIEGITSSYGKKLAALLSLNQMDGLLSCESSHISRFFAISSPKIVAPSLCYYHKIELYELKKGGWGFYDIEVVPALRSYQVMYAKPHNGKCPEIESGLYVGTTGIPPVEYDRVASFFNRLFESDESYSKFFQVGIFGVKRKFDGFKSYVGEVRANKAKVKLDFISVRDGYYNVNVSSNLNAREWDIHLKIFGSDSEGFTIVNALDVQ